MLEHRFDPSVSILIFSLRVVVRVAVGSARACTPGLARRAAA
jgi:hypothetical protein